MIVLGLTGSIGMGKTTTAALFRQAGVPVYDADAAVHALYAPGGAAVAPVEAAFPGVAVQGAIDRRLLSARITQDAEGLARLEAIVHPLVAAERAAFLEQAHDADVVVLDIPLLYETQAENLVQAVVVVTAPADVQRTRVLSRPDMTQAKFQALLARQMPDAEKRRRADFLIETDQGLEAAARRVGEILAIVRSPEWAHGSRYPVSSALSRGPSVAPRRLPTREAHGED
jgi:dephospho-CoA kinase